MEIDAVRHIKDPLYETLRNEDVAAFNSEKSARADLPSFAHGDFRGLFFPHRLEADEIVMSLNHGARMRYSVGK